MGIDHPLSIVELRNIVTIEGYNITERFVIGRSDIFQSDNNFFEHMRNLDLSQTENVQFLLVLE